MANRRAPGQTLVNLPIKEDFLKFVDSHLESMGYSDRSKFIREAMREKLLAMGKVVPVELVMPPGRAGKGGRRKTVYPDHRSESLSLNDKPNSSGRQLARKFLRRKLDGPKQ